MRRTKFGTTELAAALLLSFLFAGAVTASPGARATEADEDMLPIPKPEPGVPRPQERPVGRLSLRGGGFAAGQFTGIGGARRDDDALLPGAAEAHPNTQDTATEQSRRRLHQEATQDIMPDSGAAFVGTPLCDAACYHICRQHPSLAVAYGYQCNILKRRRA